MSNFLPRAGDKSEFRFRYESLSLSVSFGANKSKKRFVLSSILILQLPFLLCASIQVSEKALLVRSGKKNLIYRTHTKQSVLYILQRVK